MASKARTVTAADGATHLFPVSFPLPPIQGRAGVNVYVRDATNPHPGVALLTSAFTWVSDGQVNITAAPANGTVVDIRRATLDTTLENIFQAGGSMRAQDLVQNDTQLLYLIQEREDFDDDLQSQVDVEAATRAANDTTEHDARVLADSTEATTRANADNALQTNINTEASARTAAVAALQSGLATETLARSNADSTNATALTNEALARTAGDAALGTRVDNEANTRAAADATILNAIHTAGGTLSNVLVNAVDRTVLAALSTALPAFLTESGREGVFVFRTGDHTAKVAADTLQGIYVAPASDPTGASGAWVRQFSGALDIRWFGGVGDCSVFGVGTDNSPAINCAKAVAKLLGNGAAILIPKALAGYRCASTINFTESVQLLGQGYGQNPGNVGGTNYTSPANYRGSVLVFDADVAGLQFTAFTDHAANAPVTQYESSIFSIVRDLMIIGGGGVGTTAHGADIHVGMRMDNVRIKGFAGNGLNIVANTSGSSQYGNADEGCFHAVTCDANKLHGVKLEGNDANNITFSGPCIFTNNGGCGSLDLTTVGCNLFLGTQYATNNRSHPTNSASGYSAAQIALVQAEAPCLTDSGTGSAVMYRAKDYSGNDFGNTSVYTGCYVEGGSGSLTRLRGNTKVVGGYLSQVNVRHSEYNADTWGVQNNLNGVKDFYGTGGVFTFYDNPLSVKATAGTTVPYLEIVPFGALYSQIKMKGLSGSATAGLDILAGNSNAYYSADTHTIRNAAQNATYLTAKSTAVQPGSDNALTLGAASFRWSQVYAATATVNTSDERRKTAIEEPHEELLDAWTEVDWYQFQFKDAVEAKGSDGARLHFGLVAQRVRDVLSRHKIDGFALGLLCYDKWNDQFEPEMAEEEFETQEKVLDDTVPEGYRMEPVKETRIAPVLDAEGEPVMHLVRPAGDAFGVRYEEALGLEAALQRRNAQRLTAQLAALSARVDALGGVSK